MSKRLKEEEVNWGRSQYWPLIGGDGGCSAFFRPIKTLGPLDTLSPTGHEMNVYSETRPGKISSFLKLPSASLTDRHDQPQ